MNAHHCASFLLCSVSAAAGWSLRTASIAAAAITTAATAAIANALIAATAAQKQNHKDEPTTIVTAKALIIHKCNLLKNWFSAVLIGLSSFYVLFCFW